MSQINTPSVVVCYYDINTEQERQPKQITQRCTAEIIALCKQLDLVIDRLTLVLEQDDIDEAVDLCHFHYEDFLFRAYSLRERAWDVLAALAKVPRKQTNNESFRNSVLPEIESAFPKVYKAFSELVRMIDVNVSIRNVATHETFLFLGLTSGDDFQNIYEIKEVLTQYDPAIENGRKVQTMVRNALQDFITEQSRHIQEINGKAFDFVKYCHA